MATAKKKRTGTAAKGQDPRGGGRGGAPLRRIPGTTRRFMVNKKTGERRYTGTYNKRGELMTGKRTGLNARTGRTG